MLRSIFPAASQISMKTKNRFSILLEHLMSVADLKNSVLAKAVQYDDSYISKWISGKLLPTEKNHEATLQAISTCVVDSLTERGRHSTAAPGISAAGYSGLKDSDL